MTSLLIFLSAHFYGSLAILFAVAIIEQQRVASRPAAELTHEKRFQMAA